MTPRLLHPVLIFVLAACGSSPSANAQDADKGPRPFKVTEVTSFDSPWAMAFLPGSGLPLINRALVTEKGGGLWLVDIAAGRKQQVGGVPRVKVAGQGGLADVAVRLEGLGQYRVYLSFAEPGPNGTSGAAVGYGRLLFTGPPVPDGPVGVSLQDFRVIWRQAPKVRGSAHFAGRMAFAPDGSLFISAGERFQFEPAQEPGNGLGKVVRISADGGEPTPWTLGHRNPLGLAFAPDGRLWETEMGPRGGDELNLIVRGRNYGWPEASYGSHYDGRDIPDDHKSRGFEEPKVWWNPSVSPGALMIYSGDLFPQWKGDALIGALSGQSLIRVDIDGDKAKKANRWPMGARIRAVDQGPRGEVYLLEDGEGGRLLRLEPAS